MLRRAFLLWLGVLVVALGSVARADDRDDRDDREVRGTLVSINTASHPDTLVIRTTRGQLVRFAVIASTEIELDDGDLGGLEDLQVGDELEIHHLGNFVATRIEVEDGDDDDEDLRDIRGVITSINTTADPDRITVRRTNGGSVTLLVTGTTEIEVDGDDDADITDLQVGDFVEVRFDPDTLRAVRIETEDNQGNRAEARGVLVDLGANVARIDTTGDGQADLELEITDNTQIRLGDLRLDEEDLDLLVGLPVRVEYRRGATPGTGVLLKIEADTRRAEVITGDVEDIDLGDRILTLRTTAGEVIDITVPEGVRITRFGRRVDLETIAEGDRVRVLALLDRQGDDGVALRVELLAPIVRRVFGRIVDVDGSTLVVRVGNRDLRLAVDANTRISIRNRTATLADIDAALAAGRRVLAFVTFRERAGDDLALQVSATVVPRGR